MSGAANSLGAITLADVGRAYFYQFMARPESIAYARRESIRLAIAWNDHNSMAAFRNEWREVSTDDARDCLRDVIADAYHVENRG